MIHAESLVSRLSTSAPARVQTEGNPSSTPSSQSPVEVEIESPDRHDPAFGAVHLWPALRTGTNDNGTLPSHRRASPVSAEGQPRKPSHPLMRWSHDSARRLFLDTRPAANLRAATQHPASSRPSTTLLFMVLPAHRSHIRSQAHALQTVQRLKASEMTNVQTRKKN